VEVALAGRLGETEDAYLMPKFSQQILPGLPAMSEQTYAEFPVWSESSAKPVQFTPLPKREALKLWHRARDFDRQTKEKGCHGGAVGHMGLQVLQTLIFDFLNYSSGRLDPSYAAIARKANVCERTVADALKRLGDLRIITWIRRCSEGWVNGRYFRKQLTNAYCLLPAGWLGYTAPPEMAPPHPSCWGKAAVMPSIHEAAVIELQESGNRQSVIRTLELAPLGGIEAALARLGRAVVAAGN
jgi:hypothetical protein